MTPQFTECLPWLKKLPKDSQNLIKFDGWKRAHN